ncbi:MAG: WD40 repeat domain-containing protein [Microscillaceae bacterium]|nr:WD40 repeat domain-containing protein [Microscillaceae bacterium]
MSKLQVQKINTLSGHRDCIYALATGPQSSVFYSADGNGLVAVWDLRHPEIGELLARVPNSVYALCYLPAEQALLVGQNFEGLQWIDVRQKRVLRSVKITDAAIFDMQVWGQEIFVAAGDGVVIVLERESLAVKRHLKTSDKSARCLAISPDGQDLAVGYSDHHIRVFDRAGKQLKYSFLAHQNSVFTLAYHPEQPLLLSGSRDAHLKSWHTDQGYAAHQSIVAHLYALNHIVFHPEGRYFATGSMDKSVKIWDSQSLQLLKVIDKARHAGHGTSVNKLLWTAHQDQLLSASDDRLISIWEINFEAEAMRS